MNEFIDNPKTKSGQSACGKTDKGFERIPSK